MDNPERLISPSDYNQHVPNLFDGTAHLVEERNHRREAFIRSQGRTSQLDPSLTAQLDPSLMGLMPVSPTTSQSSQLSLSQPTAAQSNNTSSFLLIGPNQPLAAPSPPLINTRKRRTIAPPVSSQYQKAESEPRKLLIDWDSHDYNLERFKAATINLIQHNEDEGLGLYSQELESKGCIVWNMIIPNGRTFAAAQKKRLDSAEIFTQFLQVAEATPESRKIICCLVQKDPTMLAQKESVYKHLRLMHSGPSSSVKDPVDGPSAGAQEAASLTDLVQELGCIHKPAEHLTGSHETGVFINPEKPNKFFQMTPKQIAMWAKAIRQNPGQVTLRIPPKSDSFQFKTKDDQPTPPPPVPAQPPPPAAGVQYPTPFSLAMPPGMFFNLMHMANPMKMPPWMNADPSQNLPGTPEPPTTPPDSSLEDFLKYTHVNPESSQVTDGISTLGITHWTMFKEFKASELVSKRIPEGPACSIVSSAKKYAKHLMTS
ncbi:hypothetical protein PTTG_08206 [Puccinia triticina 1-1 BBBD Race 1]|uniref:Uncharacterized protein n=1 Tax=Puccinia triticina (isolate 1-1 / race 1 (BBBD)) TaxID=630390 RepID=A0A180G6W3_PUCT1|nr:hypothetical protein PTTG_08206 [Puccinia triticina 1-1 BBBD Race 1]